MQPRILLLGHGSSWEKILSQSLITSLPTTRSAQASTRGSPTNPDDYDLVIVSIIEGVDALLKLTDPTATAGPLTCGVIAIGSQHQAHAEIDVLNAGADELWIAPLASGVFDARLQLRIQARERREFHFDPTSNLISLGHERTQLSPVEVTILTLLAASKPSPIHRSTLVAAITSPGAPRPTARVIDHHVCILRGKLRTLSAADLVATVRHRGYAWKGPNIVTTDSSNCLPHVSTTPLSTITILPFARTSGVRRVVSVLQTNNSGAYEGTG